MPPVFAYFGPDTVLPATSIVATIVGVALMMGKNSIQCCVDLLRSAVGRGPESPAPRLTGEAGARAREDARR